jgi:hypothetical protein
MSYALSVTHVSVASSHAPVSHDIAPAIIAHGGVCALPQIA